MIGRLFVVALAVALGGCGETIRGSIAGGESKVFQAPEYAVRGETQYDQDWIDGNVEAGIAGFNWPRPKARPPAMDGAPPPRVVGRKKPGFVQRIKARVMGTPPAAPMTEVAPLQMPMMPAPPAVKPVEPIDPVDELLGIKR